jgi:hypothetical protein
MPKPSIVLHPQPSTDGKAPITSFTPVAFEDERIKAMLEALRFVHVNGGALLAAFDVLTFNWPTTWYWRTDGDGWRFDFSQFFESDALAQALPELRVGDGQSIGVAWDWTGPFTLDGELTQVLVQGAAYDRFTGPSDEAKRLAMDFCEAIFGYRYGEVNRVFSTRVAWTPWFYDIAWDSTWLIVDDQMSRVWLLCLTDTD